MLLLKWWVGLDETRVADLPKLMAHRSLTVLRTVLGSKLFSLRSMAFVAIYTFLSTSVFWIVGNKVDETWEFTLQHSVVPLPLFTVYAVNTIFDFLTLTVTIAALSLLHKQRYALGITAIVCDVIIAYVLLIACVGTLVWSNERYASLPLPFAEVTEDFREVNVRFSYYGGMKEHLIADGFSESVSLSRKQGEPDLISYLRLASIIGYHAFLTGFEVTETVYITAVEGSKEKTYMVKHSVRPATPTWLMSATTFIPTVAWMALLLITATSKMVLSVAKLSAMRILEVLTEADVDSKPQSFMPGTLMGVSFGLVTALIKVVVDVLK